MTSTTKAISVDSVLKRRKNSMIDKIGRKISWEIENIEELDVRRERERERLRYIPKIGRERK